LRRLSAPGPTCNIRQAQQEGHPKQHPSQISVFERGSTPTKSIGHTERARPQRPTSEYYQIQHKHHAERNVRIGHSMNIGGLQKHPAQLADGDYASAQPQAGDLAGYQIGRATAQIFIKLPVEA